MYIYKKEKGLFRKIEKFRLSPAQIIVSGFLLVILTGAILLSLPIASRNGQGTNIVDALFTATSAVCVTGLVVVDTGTYWSAFGKVVILIMIQIGGLGFMSLATLGAIVMGKKINLRERIIIQESLSQYSLEGVVKLTQRIILGTITIELIGAILLSFVFVPDFGWKTGILYGIFHSISGFCNAGFDLMGNYSSMVNYLTNPLLNFTLICLIICGGLGFTVMFDLLHKKSLKRVTLHTRIVLIVTAFLIVVPFILFFIIEWNNPQTIQPLRPMGKFWAILFQTVTPRTAGFNTLILSNLEDSSKFLTILLMFIGGSPASTAGGIKTVTIAVLILCVRALIIGKEKVEVNMKRISYRTVNKALAVFFIGMFIVLIGTMILSMTETNREFLDIMFEVVSAMGTVGLSMGITPTLTLPGRLVIMVIMFAGRVGALTILLALASREKKELYQYPEEKVIVG